MSDEAVNAQVDRVLEVVGYAIHPDDLDAVRVELFDVLRPMTLADYGLERGDKVKFHRSGRVTAVEGTALDVNRDGSLLVMDGLSKFQRSILPGSVQRQTLGPRGGRVWVPVELVEP